MTVLFTMLALVAPTVGQADHSGCSRYCQKRQVVRPYNAKLERMANCESSGRWWLNTGNGFYGGLQFTLSTWRAAGGFGYPHQNSKLEQKYRAVLWFRKIGTWVTNAGWPRCGYA